ncbi:MAG: VWA domain-containing protein [Salinibacterium sp.]|nr:VWA domain-containing protein [Salinibacterium sp.]
MTDPNYTALLLIIDRSGSMYTIRNEMVAGLRAMLDEQMAEPGMLTVDIVQFDSIIEHTHAMADPATVTIELDPRGATALLDAIGMAVQQFGGALAALPKHARPETVQVVIVTDGQENSSQEYTDDVIRDLITHQTEKYGWDFVFLGANQDAVLTARHLGIDAESSMTYAAEPDKVTAANKSMSRYVTDVRRKRKMGFTETERGEAAE